MGLYSGGGSVQIGAVSAHLDANTLNKVIKQVLQRKANSVTTDPVARQLIGLQYLNVVSDFIPRKSGKLVNSGRATSRGEVYWSAIGYGGYDYSFDQYVRLSYYHPSRYPGHSPRAFWTRAVIPGASAWNDFIWRITPIIIQRF